MEGELSSAAAANSEHPVERFLELLERARQVDRSIIPEPTAFSLATVGDDGRPSLRMMLLKGADERGFVFYTNFESRKGREILRNPDAALCFYWAALDAQVRVEGRVSAVSADEADVYFASRPRLSQLAAWASLQSQSMHSPEELNRRLQEMETRFHGRPIPRPSHWSGFRLEPEIFEFWSNRPGRLHERQRYFREGNAWRSEWLYP